GRMHRPGTSKSRTMWRAQSGSRLYRASRRQPQCSSVWSQTVGRLDWGSAEMTMSTCQLIVTEPNSVCVVPASRERKLPDLLYCYPSISCHVWCVVVDFRPLIEHDVVKP